MSRNVIEPYRRAQDTFEAVLELVPPSGWDRPSACQGWTVRDVAGHAIWGQEQLRHWATGQDYDHPEGAPGAPHPGQLAGDDVVATWKAARAAADEALTDENLTRTVTLVIGPRPLSAIVTLLVTDYLAHSWDIAHALGLDLRLDPDLIAGSLAWAHDNAIRAPGFFGPELTPPADADEQTRWLAYLGRATWERVDA
jgi:uncharacterized protein (TIGR03086 family)